MDQDFNKQLDEAIKTGDFDQIKCNNDEERSLLEAGKKIYQAKFNEIPADNGFKLQLLTQLKQARQEEGKKMENVASKGWQTVAWEFLTKRKWVVGIASFLLVALVASLLYWLPGGNKGANGILIPKALADEMFTFKATKMDSTGLAEESDFTLTSKIDLTLEEVKNNLKVDPDFQYEIKEISAREFLIDSQEKLNPQQIYKFTLQTTTQADDNVLESKDFAWAYQVKNNFKIENTLPRDKSNDVPINTGIEITFSHENFESIENYFSIEPAAKGRWEKHWRTMVFVPEDLQPGTMYTVTIKQGLALTGSDQKLTQDYVFQFETKGEYQDRIGDFSFSDQLTQFQADQRQILSLNSFVYDEEKSSKKELPMTIFQFVDAKQLVDYLKVKGDYPTWLWYDRTKEAQYETKEMKKLGDFSVPIFSQSYNNFVSFIEMPIQLETGYYLLQSEMNGFTHQVAVEVTDLSVYESVNTNKILLWAWNIKEQTPLATATAKLVDDGDLGQTNAEGILEAPTPLLLQKTYEDAKQFYITVEKDGQTLVLPINAQRAWDWEITDDEQVGNDYWRYLYFDRTTYQPTDKMKFWGTVAPRQASTPTIEKMTVSLEKWDYYTEDTVVAEKEINVKNNYFDGEMDLLNVPVGYYNFVLRDGNREINRQAISIVDYIKPAYELKVSADKNVIVSGEEVKFTVKANFFEGTPVSNLALSYQAYGDISGEITTDQKGEASWSIKIEKPECTWDNWNCSVDSNIITVKPLNQVEEGEIVGTAEVKVFSASYFFQRNQTENYEQQVEQNEKQISIAVKKLDFEAMNSSDEWNYYLGDYPGEAAANYPIKVKVTDEWWEKTENGEEYDFLSKQTVKKYDYTDQEKTFWEGEAMTDEQGNYVFTITQPEIGHQYYIKVGLTDEAGRFMRDSFYLQGSDYGLSRYNQYIDNYRLEYDGSDDYATETKKYKIGDKIEMELVKNNEKLAEQTEKRFLFIHYQNGLQDYTLSTTPQHEMIFGEQQIPNVFVEGLYFDGTKVNTTNTLLNKDDFEYDYTEKEANISVQTDKTIYLPGEKAEIKIDVRDKNNQPMAMAGNISLVDEAYYSLFDNNVDLGAYLYDKVGEGNISRSSSHESYFKLYSQGAGCFTGETQILLADGTTKKMEEIAVGDQIATLAAPDENILVTDRVVGKVKHLVGGYLLINNQLEVTPIHRILINGQWLTAGEAKVGDQLMNTDGQPVTIYSIEKIYQPTIVYNLTTENTHTFIADGFYVHNAKGDSRESFEDTALFLAWQTDKNGQTNIEVQLPDNLTSWRMIIQAIDNKQNFGQKVDELVVKQPIRGEMVINENYLVGDKPQISMRVYGDGLQGGEDIKAVVVSQSLQLKEEKVVKPFEDFEISLNNLTVGTHDLTLTVSSGNLKDSIKKTFLVQDSYLTKRQSRYLDLNQNSTVPVEENSKRSQVKLMNKDVGKFYQLLSNIYWQKGNRIDQLAGAQAAGKLLQADWQENWPEVNFDSTPYQRDDGGISLLPYSDTDLELSTLITMSSAKENFNQELLKEYFRDIADNKETNTNNLVKALCGLAGLGEPVLNQVNTLNTNKDLSTVDHLYLAVAMEEMGAKELAKSILQEILDNNLKNTADESFVASGGEQDNLEATKLAAIVAMATDQKDREQMLNFLQQAENPEQPLGLIMIAYIEAAKKQNIPLSSTIQVKWNNGGKKVEIKGYETTGFDLTKEEMQSLSLKLTKGNAVAVITDEIPARPEDFTNNSPINIKREYWVGDQKVEKVEAGEVVEIRLYPQMTNQAESYLIRDILPSGLQPITRAYNYNFDKGSIDCAYFYHPTAITGQKVDLMIWYGWYSGHCQVGYISYQARVANKGEFVVEPVSIQSNKDIKQVSIGKNDLDVLKIE